uniref:Uncharacterized protein LOC116950988 n=1 Tax=Petromyzon marinus TaxID=7757 RepID=A0AAJ7TVY1_PETMA|nr:uncharacterized protein LOC116950988 [Petromyzon marinus]
MFLKMLKRRTYSLIKDESADKFNNGVKLTKYKAMSFVHSAPGGMKKNAPVHLGRPAMPRHEGAVRGRVAPAEDAGDRLEATALSSQHPEISGSSGIGSISGNGDAESFSAQSIENAALAQAIELLLDQCGPLTQEIEVPEGPRQVFGNHRRDPAQEEVGQKCNGVDHRMKAVCSDDVEVSVPVVTLQSTNSLEALVEDVRDFTAAGKPESAGCKNIQLTLSCLSGQTLCCVKDCAHNVDASPCANTASLDALHDSDNEHSTLQMAVSQERELPAAIPQDGVPTASGKKAVARRRFFSDTVVASDGHRVGKAKSTVDVERARHGGTARPGSGDSLGQFHPGLLPGLLPEDDEEEVFVKHETRSSVAEVAEVTCPPNSCQGNSSPVEGGRSWFDEHRALDETVESQEDRPVKPSRQASTRRVTGLDHLDQLCCLMEKMGHQKEANKRLQQENQQLQTELQAQKLQQEAMRSRCTCGAAVWQRKAWGTAMPGLSSPARHSVHQSSTTVARMRVNSVSAGWPTREALGGLHRRMGSLREERTRLTRALTLRSDKHG